jgi:hypothetical protein
MARRRFSIDTTTLLPDTLSEPDGTATLEGCETQLEHPITERDARSPRPRSER